MADLETHGNEKMKMLERAWRRLELGCPNGCTPPQEACSDCHKGGGMKRNWVKKILYRLSLP